MGVDLSGNLLEPVYGEWARPITVTPLASQPGAPAYPGYGVYDTNGLTYNADIGMIVVDQRTIVDIIEADFPVLPRQGDQINIPADVSGPALGDFEITETASDGGGETTLTLRKLETALP
jgi:hypothetical protein